MRYFGFLVILMICCEAKYVPEDGIYAVCEQMPEYALGMKEFEAHIASETAFIENAVPGKVFVSFIVNQNGNIEQLKVVKSINPSQDDIALNAIRNAPEKWRPGSSEGKPVSVKMTYPVKFN